MLSKNKIFVTMNPVIVIPAYQPNESLIKLVSELIKNSDQRVIVVDDGSESSLKYIFEKLSSFENVQVLIHATNLGKGRALKTAFNEFLVNYSQKHSGVVTVDADGQHDFDDILKVIKASNSKQNAVVLGARDFTGTNIPFRSRFGNLITRYFVHFIIGLKLKDTQTGLRVIPTQYIEKFLRLKGERYEYEMNMLIALRQNNIKAEEVPIKTIYIESNRSSHFNPLLDSMNIYFLLARFTSSSVIAAVMDIAMFMISYEITASIAFSVFLPRYSIGPVVNFTMNKALVFKSREGWIKVAAKYALLATFLGVFASLGISWLVKDLNVSIFFSKIMVESLLFPVSFTIQRDYIFRRGEE